LIARYIFEEEKKMYNGDIPKKISMLQDETIVATVKLYYLYCPKQNIERFESMKFPAFRGFDFDTMQTSHPLKFQREEINGKDYYSIVVRRYLLSPKQAGTFEIDPLEIKLQSQSSQDNLIYIKSAPITVEVTPVYQKDINEECVFFHTNPTFKFHSDRTWKFGSLEWSDAVESNVCFSKDAATKDDKQVALCKQTHEGNFHRGNFFSWCMMQQFKDKICPNSWRLPTKSDFEKTNLYEFSDEWGTDTSGSIVWSISVFRDFGWAFYYREHPGGNADQAPTEEMVKLKKSDFAEIRCVRNTN
jgi:hypothetical protein